jgi:hypothetical protein
MERKGHYFSSLRSILITRLVQLSIVMDLPKTRMIFAIKAIWQAEITDA